MQYKIHSHRHGETVLKEEKYAHLYKELLEAIDNISDQDLIDRHESYDGKSMSMSKAINELMKERLVEKGWTAEAPIFNESEYLDGSKWYLDFAKESISVEVAFNHGEATSWNLLKPVLASELNDVNKAIQTEVGVVITATQELKTTRAFDGAVGTYEKFLTYLKPMQNQLTVPMVVIGLKAPRSFVLEKKKIDGKNVGVVHKV